MLRVVVLSPHRDDAAFSLGLAVEAWLDAGHAVTVLNCFTRSAYAPFSDAGMLHANDQPSFVTALRRREDQAWNKLLRNRLIFHDLDLLDAPLRLACAVDEVLTVNIRPGDRALARVQGAIEKLAIRSSSGDVLFLAPLAVGGHIDHRVVYQAALQGLVGRDIACAFYEDLPYAARAGAAESLPLPVADGDSPLTADLRPAFASGSHRDPEAMKKSKRRMAECYDSQIDSEVVEEIAAFSLRYQGRERIWTSPERSHPSLLWSSDDAR